MPESTPAVRLRNTIRLHDSSIRTAHADRWWSERFVRCHTLRHPATTGAPEGAACLTHLAACTQGSASPPHQTHAARPFLAQDVLAIPLGDEHALRPKNRSAVQPPQPSQMPAHPRRMGWHAVPCRNTFPLRQQPAMARSAAPA
jgi:hypothetical protein